MVSWGDGEESTTEISSDDTDTEIMHKIYGSNYCGSDDGVTAKRCKHRSVTGKFVAFEGYYTGRRFLGCDVEEGDRCDYVHWIDPEWPSSLKRALRTLWQMHGDQKRGRTSDSLNFMEQKFNLQDEIGRLHKDLRRTQDELKRVVEEKQLALALKAKAEQALLEARAEIEQKKITDAHHSNMHKVLRIKAEKDRDKLKGEKKKLEYIIVDFMKHKEQNRSRLKKIIDLCGEM